MDMVDMDGYWWVCLDSDGYGGYGGYGWIWWIWADIGGYGYPDRLIVVDIVDMGGYGGYRWTLVIWVEIDGYNGYCGYGRIFVDSGGYW